MASQTTISFGFQADIVNTASIGHLLTGRVLKAMSDGGVDFYAVAAAVYLGKFIPVRKSLESTVRPHIASRGSFRSMLSCILSIGWGHSEVAIEMSRTQAGTNALLLIGALASGGWPRFQAAQCLSELLSLNGCEADRLPNVDVLKGLVEYLAPFTFDLGFPKVLEHITTATERAVHVHAHDRDALKDTMERPRSLSELGSASMLAGAIKQLILTAEKGERLYMVLKKHGSWLPAFASHILGMAVELRYTELGLEIDGDSAIWACAGDQGSVVFELGSQGNSLVPLYRTIGSGIEMVDCQSIHGKLRVDYLLQDAMKAQLSPWPMIGDDLSEGICKAIARLSWTLVQRIRLIGYKDIDRGHIINGRFNSFEALKQTLLSMGISESSQGEIGLYPQSPQPNGYYTMEFLDPEHLQFFTRFPGNWQNPYYLQYVVNKIIHNTATSAVALMQCRFDASHLRVNLDVDVETAWSSLCANVAARECSSISDHVDVQEHLYRILFGRQPPFAERHKVEHILGFSDGAYTTFYTAIMDDDSYDALGRTISIMSGRASVNGCLRNTIIEPHHQYASVPVSVAPTTLAAGSFVEPGLQPSNTSIFLNTNLAEDAIRLNFRVGRVVSEVLGVSLSKGIAALLRDWIIPNCSHDTGTAVKVNKEKEMMLMGFHEECPNFLRLGDIVLYALRGAKLHQFLTCGSYSGRKDYTKILQFSACLKCCIEIAQKDGQPSLIIMGG